MKSIFSAVTPEDFFKIADSFVNNAGEGIIVCDNNKKICYTNPVFLELTGYEEDELIGEDPSVLDSDRQDSEFYEKMWKRISEDDFWKGTIWDRRKNGEIFLLELTIIKIKTTSENSNYYLGIFTDLSSSEKFYKNLSNYDALTNLPNRILFRDHLGFMLAHAKRNDQILAILMLDLNRFKVMNDTLGCNVGDSILVHTAERLQNAVRDVDAVFRLGNDEFAIILEEIKKNADASSVAQKILHKFNAPFQLAEYKEDLFISASIGISIYPQDGNNADDLIKNAETAMYRSKELEQNNFQHYSPSMNASLLEHLTMEHQLYKAIENNEFVVYYQPLINIESGKIIGAEALVRWMHPELGMVSPAEFIPIAEDTGLIVQIGDFVLNAACSQSKEWQRAIKKDFRISVNLSGRQFKLHDLVQKVEIILMQTELPPHSLDLEITESICMEDAETSIDVLKKFQQRGIHISIDDFGTGYSSLSYLKKFPIDVLKIDQSFVRDITDDTDSEKIVSLILSMAHTLNLKVIAEGVETEKQLEYLRRHECDMCQGYYFSKPVPAADFEMLLRNSHGEG